MKYHEIINELNDIIDKINKLPPNPLHGNSLDNSYKSIYLEGMCDAISVLVDRVAELKSGASEIIDSIIDRDSDLIRCSAKIRETFGLQENEVCELPLPKGEGLLASMTTAFPRDVLHYLHKRNFR